jgi:hypothetical protein
MPMSAAPTFSGVEKVRSPFALTPPAFCAASYSSASLILAPASISMALACA